LPPNCAPPASTCVPWPCFRPSSSAQGRRDVAQQPGFGLIVADPAAHHHQQQHWQRKCLSCDRSFTNAGPGNPIRMRCKDPDTWSTPAAHTIHAAF
jgi:hypothetical protein